MPNPVSSMMPGVSFLVVIETFSVFINSIPMFPSKWQQPMHRLKKQHKRQLICLVSTHIFLNQQFYKSRFFFSKIHICVPYGLILLLRSVNNCTSVLGSSKRTRLARDSNSARLRFLLLPYLARITQCKSTIRRARVWTALN